ncbi:MAG: hypothetical protein WAN05_10655 [Roseiarcus sp.]|jgi:hypothetical protein
MRALTAIVLAAFLLTGCCVGGYPPMWTAGPPPFNAFQAAMKLGVGMPTDVAILMMGSRPISAETKSCGVVGGFEWPCQVLTFGCCEGNQLIVYIAPTPDGRGAVNSWSVGKNGATWG